MKFVALLLLVALVGANAQSTTDIAIDFMLDNILGPLLQNLQNNALGFLFGSLNNLISGIGKRGLSNVSQTLLGLFNAHKDKLQALFQQYSSQLISFASNVFSFLGPQKTIREMTLVKMEADYAADLKVLNNQFIQQVVSTLSGITNTAALTSQLQNFFSQFEGVLGSAFNTVSGNIFATLSSIAASAIPQLQQLPVQIQNQIQQLVSNLDLSSLFNLLG